MGNRAVLGQKLKRLLFTGGAEGIGIAVNAVSGFLIVHHLPKDIYGEYTFLITCVALIVGLSDLGLGHCYLPLVGARNDDVPWIFRVCRHVYAKRWKLLLPAIFIVSPYWLYVSARQGWLHGGYLVAAGISTVGIALTLREQLVRALLAILRKVVLLNGIGIIASCARMGLILLVLWHAPVDGRLAWLVAATVGGTSLALALYRGVPVLAGLQGSPLAEDEKRHVDVRVRAIMSPLIFPMLVYQFQGAITIFLISLLGNAGSVAEVGALTRPALMLALIDRVSAILLFPVIAAHAPGAGLKRLIAKSHLIYLLAMAAILASVIALPQYWILLIGQQYEAQQTLLWMAFLAAILANASGFAFTTLSVRGMTKWQSLSVPVGIGVQCIYLAFFGASTTIAALGLAVTAGSFYFFFQYLLLGYHLLGHRE